MIECIFTIDYEIYGNGQGSLRELVYEPAEKLKEIFLKRNARFVNFVEVAELELIEAKATDPAIELVKEQIREFQRSGFELGLHIHPQWYRARYENGRWYLDYSEYNLCNLKQERIIEYLDRSISYFRKVLDSAEFSPCSFRAGNWLLQPTKPVSGVLAERGIKVDSSVFKGGVQRKNNLDYRAALRNGFYWRFQKDVNIPDPQGNLLEIPIYTQMVWPWKMYTKKRVELDRRAPGITNDGLKSRVQNRSDRFRDRLRFRYPLKFDFCRMTLEELIAMIERVIKIDRREPSTFKPIVAIGHTKDLIDFETVDAFLSYLNQKRIPVSTFKQVYPKIAIDDSLAYVP